MQKKSWLLLGSLMLIFAMCVGYLQWYKWQQLSYNGIDLAIYVQAVHALSLGQGFASTIHDPTYLGDHLELGLVPIALVYRLWNHPLVLLWAQTIILALSLWPFFLLAKRYLGERWAWLAAILWISHPLLYNAALYEFHGIVFALPLILWVIHSYLKRNLVTWYLALGLLLLVREDMPLVVAGFSVLAAIDRRNWRWWVPAGVAAIGWFIGAQVIIRNAQPLGAYKYLAFYRWLGDSYTDVITFPFRHPIVFLQHLFQLRNWLTTLSLLLAFGFLPLLRVRYLIPAAIVFFQLLLAGADVESVLRIHYVIPYIPVLAWATLSGIQQTLAGQRLQRFPPSVAITLVGLVAIVSPLYTHIVFGPAEQPYRPWSSVVHTDQKILQWAADQVSPNDRVLTTFNLLPVFADQTVYSINYVHLGRRQYSQVAYQSPTPIDIAVIDWQQYYDFQFLYRETLFEQQTGSQRLQKLLRENDLHLSAWVDSVAIYRRDGMLVFQGTERLATNRSTSKAIEITSASIKKIEAVPAAGVSDQYEVTIDWLNGERRDHPLSIRFQIKENQHILWESERLLGIGVTPSDEWQIGDEWRTRYRLAIPTGNRPQAELVASVVQVEGRLRLDALRRFSPSVKTRQDLTEVSLGVLPTN